LVTGSWNRHVQYVYFLSFLYSNFYMTTQTGTEAFRLNEWSYLSDDDITYLFG